MTKVAIATTHGERFDTPWSINAQQEKGKGTERNMYLTGIWAAWVLFKRYGFAVWQDFDFSPENMQQGWYQGIMRVRQLTERYAVEA